MTLEEVSELLYGDEVVWNDPDGGVCTKVVTIRSIQIIGDIVRIVDIEGDELECYASELS